MIRGQCRAVLAREPCTATHVSQLTVGFYQHTVSWLTRKPTYGKMLESDARDKFVGPRKKAGVTQKNLAEALGVTDHTIRNWEKGREEPRLFIWQVKTICQMFNCTLDDLPDALKDQSASDAPNITSAADHLN